MKDKPPLIECEKLYALAKFHLIFFLSMTMSLRSSHQYQFQMCIERIIKLQTESARLRELPAEGRPC